MRTTVFRLLLSAVCFLLLCPLSAQNIENTPHIEVTGTAQMEVIPNAITIKITLKEYFEGKFKVTIGEQEAKMKNMLKIAGVDLSKLNLANERADYTMITKKSRDVVTEKIFTLTLSSVPILASTYQVLSDLNINDVKTISATHSQMDSLKQAVKIKAIQDAKEKAKSLVGAIGNKLGKPLIIKENETASVRKNEEDIIEDEYMLAFRKIKIQSSVFVRFAVE